MSFSDELNRSRSDQKSDSQSAAFNNVKYDRSRDLINIINICKRRAEKEKTSCYYSLGYYDEKTRDQFCDFFKEELGKKEYGFTEVKVEKSQYTVGDSITSMVCYSIDFYISWEKKTANTSSQGGMSETELLLLLMLITSIIVVVLMLMNES